MIYNEKQTEDALKSQFTDLVPSREFFERTMERVTKEQSKRSILEMGPQDSVPSFYQIVNSFIMKKVLIVGVPLVAIVLVAVVTLSTSKQNIQVAQTDINTPGANTLANGDVADAVMVEPSDSTEGSRSTEASPAAAANVSVDSVVSSILADLDVETALAADEAADADVIIDELDSYSNIKSVEYGDII